MTKKKAIKKVEKRVKKVNEENEIVKLIKLVAIVSLIFLVFYILTIFINKEEEKETAKQKATIQYDKILAGNVLNQDDFIYYVLAYETTDYNSVVYETYADLYEKSLLGATVYTVELNNPFNSKFLSEESNFDVKDIRELKFKGVTLLKIEENKIVEHYEGEEVVAELSRLVEKANEKVTNK